MVSASSHAEADGSKLAEHLCAYDGIDNVFIVPEFMTVTKTPTASWDDVVPVVEDAIRSLT